MPSIPLLLFLLGVEGAIGVPTLEHSLSRDRDEILNCLEVQPLEVQPAAPPASLPRAELLPAGSHEEVVLNSRKRARVDQPSAARMAEPESLGIQGTSLTQVMSLVAAERIGHEGPIIPSNRSQKKKRVGNEQPVTMGNLQGPLDHLQTDYLSFHSNVGTVGLWNHGLVPGRDQPYAKQHGVVIPQDQDISSYPSLDQMPQLNPQLISSFPSSSLESSSGVFPVDPNLSSPDWLQEFFSDPQNLAALDNVSNEHAESQQTPREAVIDHSAHFHQPDHQVYDQAHLINPDAGILKSTVQAHEINTNPALGFGTESPPDFLQIKKLLTRKIELGLKIVNTQSYLKIGNFKLYDVHDGSVPPIPYSTSQDAEQYLLGKEENEPKRVLSWMNRSMEELPHATRNQIGLINEKIDKIAKYEPCLKKSFWKEKWPSSMGYFTMIEYNINYVIFRFIDQRTLKAIKFHDFRDRLATFMNSIEFYSGQIFEYLSAASKGNLSCWVTQGHFLEWVSHALFADQKHQRDFKVPIFGPLSKAVIENTSYPYYHPVQLSIIRALVISRYDSKFKYHETAMALCGYWLEYTHPEVWNQNFKNHEWYSLFLSEIFRKNKFDL